MDTDQVTIKKDIYEDLELKKKLLDLIVAARESEESLEDLGTASTLTSEEEEPDHLRLPSLEDLGTESTPPATNEIP